MTQPNLRPTTLRLERSFCPHAITLYERATASGVAQLGNDIFHVGTAAHLFLERLGAAATGRARAENMIAYQFERAEAQAIIAGVHDELAAGGRSFDGRAEPPLPADAIVEGAKLALRYALTHAFSATAFHEIGLAWGESDLSTRVKYRPEARYRLICDVLDYHDIGDDELSVMALTVRDYKSSWQAGEAELDSIQMRSQAIAAIDWAASRGVEWRVLRIEIVNLRSGETHVREIWADDHEDFGESIFAEWRRAITTTITGLARQLDTHGHYLARPGLACGGCPYRLNCMPGTRYVEQALAAVHTSGSTDGIITDVAAAWVASVEQTRQLASMLKPALAGGASIKLAGGAVGNIEQTRRVVDDAREAVREWAGEFDDDEYVDVAKDLVGVIGLGVTALGKMAKHRHPGKLNKDLRDQMVARLTSEVTQRRGLAYKKE